MAVPGVSGPQRRAGQKPGPLDAPVSVLLPQMIHRPVDPLSLVPANLLRVEGELSVYCCPPPVRCPIRRCFAGDIPSGSFSGTGPRLSGQSHRWSRWAPPASATGRRNGTPRHCHRSCPGGVVLLPIDLMAGMRPLFWKGAGSSPRANV